MVLDRVDIVRFWEGVEVRGEDDCWPWLRCCLPKGYGLFGLNGKLEYSHRVSYFLDGNVQIPELFEGLPAMICHSCDNPSCCNPGHLFLGNQKTNMFDCAVKERSSGFQRKGVNHPKALVTEAEMGEVKQHLREGILTQGEIAEMYGLTQSTIAMVNTGKQWSHIK